MIKTKEIFEDCEEVKPFDAECEELLKRMLLCNNSAKFGIQKVSDELLDKLMEEMIKTETLGPEKERVAQTIINLLPKKGFIAFI
jgi:hypothetical protein